VGTLVVNRRTLAPPQVVPEAVLGALEVGVTPSGVVLGRDSVGSAVMVRLLAPEPTTVTFVGGWWAARVVVYRLLAHGASVVVEAADTETPARHGTLAGMAQWLALGQLAGTHRVRPAEVGPSWASAAAPLVLLDDTGVRAAAPRPIPEPWQTRLVVLSRVTPDSQQLVAGSDLVLAQRLDPREAALVGSALLLPAEFAANAGTLQNEMVAVCRAGVVRYVWLSPTTVERRAFG
jgi:hypothetical protein